MTTRALGLLAVLLLSCKEGAKTAGDGGAAAAVAVDAAPVAAAIDATKGGIDAAKPAVVDARPPDAARAAAVVDARPPDARPADAAAPATVDAAAAAAAAPSPADAAPAKPLVDAAAPATAPDAAKAAQATPPPAAPAGDEIVIDEPRVVGDADVQPILDALNRVKPQLEGCRPRGTDVAKVKVQFHVGLGKLGLAAPAADNTGDPSVARCIANRVKSARPEWKEGESGIIIVEASLPPRK